MLSRKELFQKLKLPKKLKKLNKDEKGIALIEFAIAAPVLAAVLLGCVDLTYLIVAHERVSRAAYTMSNLMTQMDQGLSESQVNDLLLALDEVSKPFTVSTSGVATITAIIGNGIDGSAPTNYTVAWQRCYGSQSTTTGLGSEGDVVAQSAFPEDTIVQTSQILIVTEIDYTFTPIVGILPISTNIKYDSFFRPRRGTIEAIVNDGATPSSC